MNLSISSIPKFTKTHWKNMNLSISSIPKFVKTHWKTMAYTVGAVAIAGTAVYLTNQAAQEALDNMVYNVQNRGADFFDWLEGRPTRAERDAELERTIREINEQYEIDIKEIDERYEREQIEWDLMWEAREQRDREESQRMADEWYEQWERDFYWGEPDPTSQIEKDCRALNPDDFREMSDVERLTHPYLNPNCCEHAKILLTPKGMKDTAEIFSSIGKINSIWRNLSKVVHPDTNPGLVEAERAFATVTAAKEILKLCLS